MTWSALIFFFASASVKRMTRTPAALRPISRTSDSLKWMLWPSVVAMTMSSFFETNETEMSSSPASRVIAIRPDRRTSWKCLADDFLPVPFFVTIIERQSVGGFLILRHRQNRSDFLAVGEREKIHDRLALCRALAFRDLVHLYLICLAFVGKEEQVVMRRSR